MLIRAEQKFVRMSPTKIRLVARALRGIQDPQKALTYLSFVRKRAALPLSKVIKTAIANAQNNMKLDRESLQIWGIQIGEGPVLKRGRAGSRGMARPILKRMSHIRVILEATPQKESSKVKNQKSKIQVKSPKETK